MPTKNCIHILNGFGTHWFKHIKAIIEEISLRFLCSAQMSSPEEMGLIENNVQALVAVSARYYFQYTEPCARENSQSQQPNSTLRRGTIGARDHNTSGHSHRNRKYFVTLNHAHYCNINVIFCFVPFLALYEQNRIFFLFLCPLIDTQVSVPWCTSRWMRSDFLLFHADDLIIPTRCWKALQFTCHELCLRVCLTDICSSQLLTASTSVWHRAALRDNWQDAENTICITFKSLKVIPSIKITDAVSSIIYEQAT